MTASVVLLVFTHADRARALEVRAFAERPENLHIIGGDKDTQQRLDAKQFGAIFGDVRTCYTISWMNGARWRVISFSVEGPSLPPEGVCWAIAVELFGFVYDRKKTAMIMDPIDPTVRGFAQKLAEPSPTERPS
jgi:hypothetical protein